MAAVVIVWLCRNIKSPATAPQTTNATVVFGTSSSSTNTLTYQAPAVQTTVMVTNTANLTPLLTNTLTSTNIAQWTGAIKGLNRVPNDPHNWLMEVADPATHAPLFNQGVPLLLEKNGKTVTYDAHFISINTKNEQGDILEIQLMSSLMNIDETRQMGLQLFEMLGLDSRGFQAWCNNVGNGWMDVAPYSTGNHYYIIQTVNSYNKEHPWVMNLLIMYPNQ